MLGYSAVYRHDPGLQALDCGRELVREQMSSGRLDQMTLPSLCTQSI